MKEYILKRYEKSIRENKERYFVELSTKSLKHITEEGDASRYDVLLEDGKILKHVCVWDNGKIDEFPEWLIDSVQKGERLLSIWYAELEDMYSFYATPTKQFRKKIKVASMIIWERDDFIPNAQTIW